MHRNNQIQPHISFIIIETLNKGFLTVTSIKSYPNMPKNNIISIIMRGISNQNKPNPKRKIDNPNKRKIDYNNIVGFR